jgi:hypothetical protein
MEKAENKTPKKGIGSYFTSFLSRIGGVFLARSIDLGKYNNVSELEARAIRFDV